jgi:tetratricopeptide (TPR) repeat protein
LADVTLSAPQGLNVIDISCSTPEREGRSRSLIPWGKGSAQRRGFVPHCVAQAPVRLRRREGHIFLYSSRLGLVAFLLSLAVAGQVRAGSPQTEPNQSDSSQPQVDAAYQKGMQLLNAKRYQDALEQFRWVEAKAPQSPQGASGQGIALALLGKPQEATEALERALKLDPSFWVARRELGIVYWSQGRKDEAAKKLEPLSKLHPDDAPVNAILGQYAFGRQDYSGALAYLSRVPAQVSADARLSLMEAEALLKTGQTPAAAERLKGLVGRPGLTPDQTFELAWLLGQAKLYKTAIEVFQQVPGDFPDAFQHAYGLALAYFSDGQYQECIDALQTLAARGITRPELFALRGVAEEKSGHTKEAYDAFRQGILTNPRDPLNYLNIATLASEHLNYDLAMQILTSGIERVPESHALILSRGIAYTLKTQFALARQDYNHALQLAPDDPACYMALGLMQLETGDLEGAIRSFEESAQRGANDPHAYYFLTEALMQKGAGPGTAAFDRARQAIDKALALDAHFAYAYLDRAKLELKADQVDEALQDLQHAQGADPKSSSIVYLMAQAYQRKGEKARAQELLARVKETSEQEARDFRRSSLTQALVVLANPGH